MAAYTIGADQRGAYEKQLAANTADTITINRAAAGGKPTITVINLDGGGADPPAAIYLTDDGAAPTVAGAHCHAVYGIGGTITIDMPGNVHTPALKLISSAAVRYSVVVTR